MVERSHLTPDPGAAGPPPVKLEEVTIRDLLDVMTRLTLGSVGFLLAFLGSVFSAGIFLSPNSPDKTPAEQQARTDPLIQAGEKQSATFVMPSVVVWTRLDAAAGSRDQLVADQRITYSLHALRAIALGDRLFEESYHSQSTDLQYLPGTEAAREAFTENQPQGLAWQVPFEMKAHEQRAIMTGVHRTYRAGEMLKARPDHAGRTLQPNQDEYCYRNVNDDIGEMVIGVESTSLKFRAGSAQTFAYVSSGPGAVNQVDVPPFHPTAASPIQSLAVHRFSTLARGETACLVVAW